MKEKIENPRGIRKTILLYLGFAESANGIGRDTEFYTVKRKGGLPCRTGLMWYINVSVTRKKWGTAQDVEIYKQS